MSKVIYKGLKENGLIDAELKRTPVLITELIEKVTKEKTSKMDIVHDLEEIRKSAEQDQRIAQTYVHCLKTAKRAENDRIETENDEVENKVRE